MLQILEMPQRGRRFRRKIIKYCFRKRRSMTFPKRSQGSERITGKSNNHILEGYHQNQVSEAIRTLESSITTYHQARLSTKKAPGLDCPSGPQMKVSGTVCDRRDPRAILPGGHGHVGVNVTVTGETVTGSAQNCLFVTDGHGQVHVTVKRP